DEARDHYEKAIDINPKSALTCYACHNLTEILWIQGKYDEGRFAWERALQIYEQRAREEEQNENADFFLYYGAGIIRYARDLQTARGEAIDVFRRGLAIDQKHTGILAATITTALDWLNEPCNEGNDVSQSVNTFLATTVKTMFDWLNGPRNEGKDVSQSVVTFHKVREYFKRAESVLKERLNTVERQENIIIETKQELGNLYVIMEEYDKAETELTEVCKKNSESSAAHTYLGVLYFRKGDYGKAKQCFERARRIDRDDLNLWSNLAEVYLKINPKELTQIEKAECEFKKILKAAHDHIDSLIGLGEVFVSKAEAGDEDFYDGAIKYYNQAIELAEKSQGSKLLTNREKASLHYSLGYARVMFYEASRPLANESMLKEARKDFKKSVRENPEHYKAQMALEKLEKRLGRFSRSLFSEKLSAWLVVMLSTFVFVMAQWSVIHDIKAINGLAYSGLTFGSLIFIVVGLYLPSIQKLKGAGIELEKSTTTHISGPSSIKIAK
ncbi:MAG: tetratricopeptide repeat protein, partial [Chlorobiaceae bacterium]|nr:tetratricopeptide repeat protein [Chlorobiaceae bacterium]